MHGTGIKINSDCGLNGPISILDRTEILLSPHSENRSFLLKGIEGFCSRKQPKCGTDQSPPCNVRFNAVLAFTPLIL
jgi:hypothetical protein